jgi:hypothetical protein
MRTVTTSQLHHLKDGSGKAIHIETGESPHRQFAVIYTLKGQLKLQGSDEEVGDHYMLRDSRWWVGTLIELQGDWRVSK